MVARKIYVAQSRELLDAGRYYKFSKYKGIPGFMAALKTSGQPLRPAFLSLFFVPEQLPNGLRGVGYIVENGPQPAPWVWERGTSNNTIATELSHFLEGEENALRENFTDGERFAGQALDLVVDISGRTYQRVLKRLEERYDIQVIPF